MPSDPGVILRPAGVTDRGAAVPYLVRTGNMALSSGPSRTLRLVYSPTAGAETLTLNLHFNNSSAARANAIVARGDGGFNAVQGGGCTLNLAAGRSDLGTSNGMAQARFSGSVDDRSSGSDRHVAFALSGSQTAYRVTVHALAAEGVE
jgi:hypothetical protein